MKIIQNNPYRIVGLLAGSTAREQTKQISRLKKFIEAEQEPQDDFSFPILGNLRRTINDVDDASSKLNLDTDKINAAMFWFWNGNPITDEAAFDALKSGDIETANEIWNKLITITGNDGQRIWKPVSEKNYSAFHNFFILNLIRANGNLHNGIVANLRFLESDLVQKFVSSVADEKYKADRKELQLMFLNQLHSDIDENKKNILPRFLEILNKSEFIAKQDFMKGFVQKPIEQIEHKIEVAKNKRKSSKSAGAKAGQELFSSTTNDLAQVKSIVGVSDIKYASIADKVANEILQCSIDYFNDSQEKESSTNYAEIAMKLAKQAETLAVGKLTRDRVKDNIETLEEMKDRELSQAIELIKSIKEAYETNEKNIRHQVRIQEASLSLNQSINWTKVNEMIANSIDWDKVVELIKKVIPQENIEKIKNMSNPTKIAEYKTLVAFLMNTMSYHYKNKIAYINYWEQPKTTRPSSTSTITFASPSTSTSSRTTTSSSSSDGWCYIATMAYGSYEHPQVLELRKFRDEILVKSIFGKLFVKIYYFLSPKLVRILKNNTRINAFIRQLLDQFIKIIK